MFEAQKVLFERMKYFLKLLLEREESLFNFRLNVPKKREMK